ncbi:hypothetical protein SBV1_1530014 [Verrucomicrobia bacterium]|nr:hypothetical protein SBV1_1530014 [Verrucomicrobiota bacterium]
MNCLVCGNGWTGAKTYCPRCGSPVLPRSRRGRLWKLTIAFFALLFAAWWTAKWIW